MLRFREWVIILLFAGSVFFHFRGVDFATGKDEPYGEIFEKKIMFFILDFRDFSCMSCLDSFLGLYRQLPSHFQTSGAWGILSIKESERDNSAQFWIAEKKLRGFVRANRITFPILVDRGHLFDRMAERGSCVLLLDGAGRLVHRYDFPLTGAQFEEIFRILNK